MEYLVQSKNMMRNVLVCIVFVSICVIAFYLFVFHNGLSDDSSAWSNFGDYMNGVLTPILTAINIYVFIRLTSVISEIEDKRANELLKQEELRSEKEMQQAEAHFERELKHEKELLLMQLRKQEIDTFVNQTNRIYDYSSKEKRIQALQQVTDYLTSFTETGFKWFNIEDKNHTERRIGYLTVSLRTILFNLEENKETSEDIYNKVYDAKAEITNTLVEAALKP